jgi:transposase-like protein
MKKEEIKRRKYSDEFKWRVVHEVLSGNLTKEAARRVYGIKGKSAVLNWLRKFGGIESRNLAELQPLSKQEEKLRMKELSEKDKRIKELEAELSRERLRADLWQKIVELAEEQLNIDVRKKFGAKPSIPSKKTGGKQ